MDSPAKRHVNRPKPRSHGPAPRFTLIELLTVIAIIAILAAILFATLSSVRGKGKETLCLNNLSNSYKWHQTYVGDSDGYLPPNEYAYTPFQSPIPETWDTVLVRNGYATDTQLLHCPTWEPHTYQRGYVYGGFKRDPGKYDRLDAMEQQLGVSASNVVMLVDSIRASDRREIWWYAHDNFGCWQRIHCRHQKQAQAAFADGHIEKLDQHEVVSGRYKPVPEYHHGHWYIIVE